MDIGDIVPRMNGNQVTDPEASDSYREQDRFSLQWEPRRIQYILCRNMEILRFYDSFLSLRVQRECPHAGEGVSDGASEDSCVQRVEWERIGPRRNAGVRHALYAGGSMPVENSTRLRPASLAR